MRLLRTLARARTWGGVGSGSRAITRPLSGPGLRTPRGGGGGVGTPPVRPPGAPGARVAAPWGCHALGAVGSMVGCTAGCGAGVPGRAPGGALRLCGGRSRGIKPAP